MTLDQFLKKYPDDDSCLQKIKELKDISCPRCQGKKLYKVKGRPSYACTCGQHVRPLSGTVFRSTKLPLRHWFLAMYLLVQSKNGLSAGELKRHLGVTHQTAWKMNHKLRGVMKEEGKLKGEVEIDESFIGGKSENRAEYFFGRYPDKDVVVGMVERGGKAKLVQSTKYKEYNKYHALNIAGTNIEVDSRVISDEGINFSAFSGIFRHDTVSHSRNFRVGDIYTQNIENIWSHLKRGIVGTYRWVSTQHLQKYADEFAFRYNYRKEDMFEELLSRATSA